MSYGLEIRNAANEIQIDEAFANFYKKATGTCNFSSTAQQSTIVYVGDVDFSSGHSAAPIIAVKPTAYQCMFKGTIDSSNTGIHLVSTESGGGSIDYVEFDKAEAGISSGGDWGLQVFDGSADRTFNSNDEHMIVVDVHTKTWDPFAGAADNPGDAALYWVWTTDITVNDATNNYFAVFPYINANWNVLHYNPSPVFWVMGQYSLGFRKKNSTTVTLTMGPSNAYFLQGGPTVPSAQPWQTSIILLELSY